MVIEFNTSIGYAFNLTLNNQTYIEVYNRRCFIVKGFSLDDGFKCAMSEDVWNGNCPLIVLSRASTMKIGGSRKSIATNK